MAVMHEGISGIADPTALDRIAEALDREREIRKVAVKGDVMLVRREDVVVTAANEELAGAGSRGIEVAG